MLKEQSEELAMKRERVAKFCMRHFTFIIAKE